MVDSALCRLGTIVATLVDLLHMHRHVPPLCTELCTLIDMDLWNALTTKVLSEIGWLDIAGKDNGVVGGKVSKIKNVALFLSELAAVQPCMFLAHFSLRAIRTVDCPRPGRGAHTRPGGPYNGQAGNG